MKMSIYDWPVLFVTSDANSNFHHHIRDIMDELEDSQKCAVEDLHGYEELAQL